MEQSNDRDLLGLLASFNRKERFYLVGWVLGNPGFELSEGFRGKLGKALDIAIPKRALAAMDYHLDWIYGSLFLSARGESVAPFENDGRVSATQEDVDLLVAFEEAARVHLIMLEAKGATGWTNAQLDRKARRLRDIFGEAGTDWEGVSPHFVIASPVRSQRLSCRGWPRWMAPNGEPCWLAMPMPEGLRRISRCAPDGRSLFNGTHWTVMP